ncbi:MULTISPECIES: alcohol dehydrogenase catalytic domain-containing protein [Cryobacterium]|uniref:alcohol dehydrogenase catalytic domain-containing protein n=1 Tax=Cryobacterium sandaracinum TaxID=1259247 RepID=UPI0018E06792
MFDFSRIQGGDITGIVVEVGHGVTEELLGRRVLVDPAIYGCDSENASPAGYLGSEADGGFAQYVAVDAIHAHDVLDSPLSDVQLACLPVGIRHRDRNARTCQRARRRNRARDGSIRRGWTWLLTSPVDRGSPP